jgi:hypothetical protein
VSDDRRYHDIVRRLRAAGRREQWTHVLTGLCTTAAVSAAVITAFVIT